MSPGPGNSRQWSQWPEQDRAQTQSFLATHCPPPSSCAMSSLLLLPYRASEAAEAYEAGTGLCPSLWRQKIPHPMPANNSMLAQLMHKAPAPNSLTKAFICIWCASFTYGSLSLAAPPQVSLLRPKLSSLPYLHSQVLSSPRRYSSGLEGSASHFPT